MRLRGKDGIGRVIYTAAPGRRLVVLHAFVKKTQKTPRSALYLALTRLKELS
jgi:phage-related protein